MQLKGQLVGELYRNVSARNPSELITFLEGCGNKCNKNEGIFQGCRVIGTGVHRGGKFPTTSCNRS